MGSEHSIIQQVCLEVTQFSSLIFTQSSSFSRRHIFTLKREKMIRWWAFDSTGKPFLFVKKMLVGSIAALMGSPSHFSITVSDGMSAPTSIAWGKQREVH